MKISIDCIREEGSILDSTLVADVEVFDSTVATTAATEEEATLFVEFESLMPKTPS